VQIDDGAYKPNSQQQQQQQQQLAEVF